MNATNKKLADALREIDAPKPMIERAEAGYYHDFMSDLPMPALQLASDLADLISAGNMGAVEVRRRHLEGEFDATDADAEEWAKSPEGIEAFESLMRRR